MECEISNIGECISEQIFGYFNNLINSAIEPILEVIKNMLISNIDLSPFHSIWQIMLYLIGVCYLIIFVYCGITLMHSGGDPVKRTKAKSLLQNTIILLMLTSMSYFMYDAILSVVSHMTNGFYDYVNQSFLQSNGTSNFALEFVLSIFYLITLLFTVSLMGLRNFVVAVAVILLPLALFMYTLPMIKSFGKIIINCLIAFTLIPLVNVIILIVGSMLSGSMNSLFVPLITFLCINIVTIAIILFVIVKSGMEVMNTDFSSMLKK
jgi:hypothetical protein